MVEGKTSMKSSATFAIGVDLGATTVKAGVVDKHGKLIDHFSVETKAHKGPETVTRQIVLSVQELFSRHKKVECAGIGIGSPGIVDIEEQVVWHPPNFADWSGFALGAPIRKTFNMPVFMENDANCAAIAEARWGAGMDFKNFLFVIWGTGVGGGIILNNKIHRGPSGGAGEIGHISIDYNGPDCNCGSRGCVEAYIGQRYVSRRTKAIFEKMPEYIAKSKLTRLVKGNLDRIEPYVISKAAEEGDKIARQIMEEAGQFLGYALASALNVLDLHVIVIGGGISAAPEFVFDSIRETVKSRVLKSHGNHLRILRAQLGNTAGMLGAASIVLK
jgi:glucokinase